MPFPFQQMPTLAEFKTWACDRGCKRYDPSVKISGPRNASNPRCLIGPNDRVVILPNMSDDERLAPSTVEGYCRQLGIESYTGKL